MHCVFLEPGSQLQENCKVLGLDSSAILNHKNSTVLRLLQVLQEFWYLAQSSEP